MIFASPVAFRYALEARIRNEARARRQPVARVRRPLGFERILARVVASLRRGAALASPRPSVKMTA
jgi:hypothetical protein